MLKSVQTIS